MMETETVPLDELHSPEINVRLHPPAQIDELKRAVEMFGQTRPIVIDEDGTVLAGNGLLEALRGLGHTTAIALRMHGLTRDAKAKLMLSDNKIYMLGHDDYDGMMSLIRGLEDLDIPGFDQELLTSLLASDKATLDAMDQFGRMNDEEKARRTNMPIGKVTNVGGKTVVTCPHCGQEFSIT